MKGYKFTFTLLALFGCSDTVDMQTIKEKLLLENKRYFNSERASKILYEESSKYLKYGTFLYSRPQSILTYYIVLGDEPPYRIKKITKKQADKIDKEGKGSYLIMYIDGKNRIDAMIRSSNALIHYFDVNNKKSLFEIKNDIPNMNEFQTYRTSCNFRYGKKICSTSEDGGDSVSYGQDSPLKYADKAFKNYYNYYNGKKIIYDNKFRKSKKIDYKNKKIKYYFYDLSSRYEVVCDYKNERCEIMHNCDYKHKDGSGGCSLISFSTLRKR